MSASYPALRMPFFIPNILPGTALIIPTASCRGVPAPKCTSRIHRSAAQMLRLLIKQIVLTDDTIKIYYNTTDRKRPDEEDTHQAFCFYSENVDYENRGWWFTMNGDGEYGIEIKLLI